MTAQPTATYAPNMVLLGTRPWRSSGMERKLVPMMVPEVQVFVSFVWNQNLKCVEWYHSFRYAIICAFFPLFSVEGIISYFKKQVGPASVELKDDVGLQAFISDKDGSVVGELLSEFKSFLCFMVGIFTASPQVLCWNILNLNSTQS